MKTTFSCTLNAIIRGRLCEVAYIRIPYFPLFYFIAINGVGAWAFMPLSYASDSGAARICQRGRGPKQGSEATERGDGVGGEFPTVGRYMKIRV